MISLCHIECNWTDIHQMLQCFVTVSNEDYCTPGDLQLAHVSFDIEELSMNRGQIGESQMKL